MISTLASGSSSLRNPEARAVAMGKHKKCSAQSGQGEICNIFIYCFIGFTRHNFFNLPGPKCFLPKISPAQSEECIDLMYVQKAQQSHFTIIKV